jgi:hypothetical protein
MYNKIFTKILDSSIWLEPTPTRIVWVTLIAAMDEDGFVQSACVANLAHKARVTLKEATEAVKILEGPDENSSDKDNDGRRIEKVPGGWMVLNASKYRELVTRAVSKEQTRIRVARHRAKKHGNADVTLPLRFETQSEAYTDTESDTESGSKRARSRNGELRVNSPSLSEAIEFGKTISLPKAECEAWHDHFASNGWKISGKTPMKDWKASMRTWKRNHEAGSFRSKQPSKPTIPKYQDDRGEDDPL